MIGTESYPDREKYTWEAHYLDGTILEQEGHKVKDIDQERLHSVHILGGASPIIISWRPGLKFIHFYRNTISMSAGVSNSVRLYCFGYQDGNSKTILVFAPGIMIITDDIDNIKVEL